MTWDYLFFFWHIFQNTFHSIKEEQQSLHSVLTIRDSSGMNRYADSDTLTKRQDNDRRERNPTASGDTKELKG